LRKCIAIATLTILFLNACLLVPEVLGQSIIQNGGFESWVGGVPTFWTLVSGTIHQNPGYTGAFSCRLGGSTTGQAGWNQGVVISQRVSIVGGAPCTFDFWAKADNPWGSLSARAELRWLDSSLGLITQQAVSISGAAWARYGPSVYTAPVSAAFLEIRFVKASWGYLDVDEVSLVTAPPAQSDLTVMTIGLTPPNPVHGDDVFFHAMVVNQGGATANNIRVDCYVDGAPYGQGIIPSLSAGASMQMFTTTPWRAAQGPHMFRWVVDPINAIAESNEFNNEMSQTFIVSPPPFDFSLSATPPSQSVNQGQQTTYLITATLTSGLTQTVTLTLSGLPTGATYSFSPPSGNPTFTSTLTVTTSTSTPTGTYTLTVAATGGKTAQVTLTVMAAPDFTIAVSTMSQTVLQRKTTTYTVSITPLGGFNAPISLSLLGLPTDASYSFSPPTLTSGASTLTVNAGDITGTYTLTVSGMGGGITRPVTVTLTVLSDPSLQAWILTQQLIAIVAAAVLAAFIFLYWRRRKKKRKKVARLTKT